MVGQGWRMCGVLAILSSEEAISRPQPPANSQAVFHQGPRVGRSVHWCIGWRQPPPIALRGTRSSNSAPSHSSRPFFSARLQSHTSPSSLLAGTKVHHLLTVFRSQENNVWKINELLGVDVSERPPMSWQDIKFSPPPLPLPGDPPSSQRGLEMLLQSRTSFNQLYNYSTLHYPLSIQYHWFKRNMLAS